MYLSTPLGSVLSSMLLNRIGHKKCMILTNVPYMVSQIMFFYAERVQTMYACSILMGLSVGFSGGPLTSYVGEVSEPKLRGTLMAATNVLYFAGFLILTITYAITKQWRLTVLIGIAIPIINMIILILVTERYVLLAQTFVTHEIFLRHRILRYGCCLKVKLKKHNGR